MKRVLLLAPLLAAVALPAAVCAQPADLPIPAATTTEYPAGISVSDTEAGPVYTDSRGLTLYGLDLRTVQRWSPDAAQYCATRCEEWEPVLAPQDAAPNIAYPRGFGPGRREWVAEMAEKGYYSEPEKAPDWTIIEGPHGKQWVYKGWHMVYTRKGDTPGSTAHDGEDELTWNTLKFVPPVPRIVAPANVEPVYAGGAYALSLAGEKLLFTGECKADCGEWEPLQAGFASRGLGEWQVSRTGDVAQWTLRGQPVFVSGSDEPAAVPEAGNVLRP
jgi:predicted lipoprotein with Yx(FWY)xxD motif